MTIVNYIAIEYYKLVVCKNLFHYKKIITKLWKYDSKSVCNELKLPKGRYDSNYSIKNGARTNDELLNFSFSRNMV